ncbi:uncharacterized protein LOC117107399 isoform X2 [Anneissia japonica]|nr:uncharacterized protein LOC117107399 isoform X2 [Anneissia japonica]
MHEDDGKIRPYRVIVDPRDPMKYSEPSPRPCRKHIGEEDKKEQHRMNERFRHHNLNLAIQEMVKIIPYPQGGPPKNETKYNILHRASAYMNFLKSKISELSNELDMQCDFVEGYAVFDKPFHSVKGGKKYSIPAFSPLSNEDVEGLLGRELPPTIPIYKPKSRTCRMAPSTPYVYGHKAAVATPTGFTYTPVMPSNISTSLHPLDNQPIPVMVSNAMMSNTSTPFVVSVFPNPYIASSIGGRQIAHPKAQLQTVNKQVLSGGASNIKVLAQCDATQNDVPVSDFSSASPTSSVYSLTTTTSSPSDILCGNTQTSEDSLVTISQEDRLSLMSDDILMPGYNLPENRILSEDSSTFDSSDILTKADILTAVAAMETTTNELKETSFSPYDDVEDFSPISDVQRITNEDDSKSLEAVSPDDIIGMSINPSNTFDQSAESDEEFFPFMEDINETEPDLWSLQFQDTAQSTPPYGVNVMIPTNIQQVLNIINGPQDVTFSSARLDHDRAGKSSFTSSPYKSPMKRSWINGYQLFTKINHHKFRSSWPKIQGREITRLLGQAWKDFPKEYKTLYSQHACELNEYNRILRKRSNNKEQEN